MADIQHPGVYVQEVDAAVSPIEGVPTAVVAFVGWTRRGRTGRAWRVRNFAEYQRRYGAPHADSYVGFAIRHFFENGGQVAYVLRLTAPGRNARDPNHPAMIDALLGRDERQRGMSVLSGVDAFDVLCVPGLTDIAALAALQQLCNGGHRFLIVDCDAAARIDDLRDHGPDPRLTTEASASSALYFPWIEASDPTRPGHTRAFPPSGFVAGVYARTDATRGVWNAPAGTDAVLNGAVRPTVPINDDDARALNARAVNCLRQLPAGTIPIWGARTLQGSDDRTTDWKYVNVRRLMLYIEWSLLRGLQWVAFEPNDERLWTRILVTVENFLSALSKQGAFQGAKAQDSYLVRCGRETMTQTDIDQGIVIIQLGVAPLRPAEFVILSIRLIARPPCR